MSLSVFLVAGEPSGDLLGAALMRAISKQTGADVRFSGVGGERMIEAGLASLFPMSDLSVMGLAEVLPRIPRLLGRVRETVAAIRQARPDIVVTIDAPDFCSRVASRLRGSGIPIAHYVAPTVWAWRPGRAKKWARLINRMLALFPFEPPYFQRAGLACSYVGHPALEAGFNHGDGAGLRSRLGISASATVLCILPGSREGEVSRLLPVFSQVVKRLVYRYPGLVILVPTVAPVAALVEREVARWPLKAHVIRGERQKIDAFAASTVALAASGTVSLQLSLARLPQVITYRVSRLTAFIARRMIRVPYVSLPNILLDRSMVPELLQENCDPGGMARAIAHLLDDRTARPAQLNADEEIAALLGESGPAPSERAARVVIAMARGETIEED